MQLSVGEIIRKAEQDFYVGNTKISEHVTFSMRDTLSRTDAYLNSKHISGETDSLGREKPFFNIVTALVNVWYRATDIDRSHIQLRATKRKDWINSFLATVVLRDWMRKHFFGIFLNKWGRALSKYGSAVVKFVPKEDLNIRVIPWNRLIVDAVDFDSNPTIEIIELNEAQLRERVETHGYDKEVVDELMSSLQARENTGNQKKDNKADYIKIFELHGVLSKDKLTGKPADEDKFVQQMHAMSFVETRKGRKTEHQDFTLYSGVEEVHPYELTHLIEEDDRTLSIGAVEHAFVSQWMTNHTSKNIKDTLDLASRMIFQTADGQFLGRNVLSNIETGDILIHTVGNPLTQLNNSAVNTAPMQSSKADWKQLGNEANSVSESMLGETPKSGTAWRQTEAILQESHSLFELMTENKGLQLEKMFRERIIPHIKTKLNTNDEVTAILEQHEIDKIDSIYIKNSAIKQTNRVLIDKILKGEDIMPGEQEELTMQNEQQLKEGLDNLGGQRFFAPSEINWKKQFENMEWDIEVDITGEAFNKREAMTTLATALNIVVQPGFEQNKKAQMIVGRILEMTGTMSPVEYNSLPATPQLPQQAGVGETPKVGALPELT